MFIFWSYPPDDWLIYHQVEQIYQSGGLPSIIRILEIGTMCKLPETYVNQLVAAPEGGVTFKWVNTQQRQIHIITQILRKRHLLKTLVRKWITTRRNLHHTHQIINTSDLCSNTFQEVSYLEVMEYGKTFRFSVNDITNLFTQALQARSEIRATPIHPKNPYTNQEFSILDTSRLYHFARDGRNQLPELVTLYHICGFNLDKFRHRYNSVLNHTACFNYTLDQFELSDSNLLFYELVEEIFTFVKNRLPTPPKAIIRQYCQKFKITGTKTTTTRKWHDIITNYLYISYYLTTVHQKKPFIINPTLYEFYLDKIVKALTSFIPIMRDIYRVKPARYKGNQSGFQFRGQMAHRSVRRQPIHRRQLRRGTRVTPRPLVIGAGISILFTSPVTVDNNADSEVLDINQLDIIPTDTESSTNSVDSLVISTITTTQDGDSIPIPINDDSTHTSILGELLSEVNSDYFQSLANIP